MTWSNYLVNDKLNIAIEVGKFDHDDNYDDLSDNLKELEQYLNNEAGERLSMDVVKYIMDKIITFYPHNLLYNLFLNIYGPEWTIEPEQKVQKGNYRIIER